MSREQRGHWLQTVTGRRFYVCDPQAEDIAIEDIAHALSMLCRFGGHCRRFYSVGEHSVRVARAIRQFGGSTLDVFGGLLHDASEAYLGDVVWPLKRAPELDGYRHIEGAVEHALALKFGLPTKLPAIVKRFDLVLLATEKRDLMGEHDGVGRQVSVAREVEAAARQSHGGAGWHIDDVAPLEAPIVPWSSAYAEAEFLTEFARLASLGGRP